ncbi:MAG: RNA-directed polymerase [Cryptosporangiaceae bacterium]|nr:RNA-directed polymerase [Cryptosporangiaceae bacterium]
MDSERRRALFGELQARAAGQPGRAGPPRVTGPLGRSGEQFAGALADAFLAGEWSEAGLRERGLLVIGRRRAWLRPVVAAVLRAYRDAPADRPRELGAFVAALPVFGEAVRAARRAGKPLKPLVRIAEPAHAVRWRWPVRPLDGLADLGQFLNLDPGELDWFADRQLLSRRAAGRRLRHYRYHWVPTRSGGVRLLEAPKERLKGAQRRVLAQVVALIPAHPAAHGFRPGRSVHTFAAPHAGQQVVVRLDLEGFFASVTAGRVYGVFRTAGYPEAVAHALTGLCTAPAPWSVLAVAPDATGLERLETRRRLVERLRVPHLPQGAPTSPALASLCSYRLDVRLAGLAARLGCAYTRYADDLAFSADSGLATGTLIAAVRDIAESEGFRLNEAKTAVMTSAHRQRICGLVVNARPAVARTEYDTLRAILHNAARSGPESQNRAGHPDFRAHLLGRISWVEQSSAVRGARLRETFGQIRW